MPFGKKVCPKCSTEAGTRATKCKNAECDHIWPKKRKTPKGAPPPSTQGPEHPLPKFAAGLTSDDGLYLAWPDREETLHLNKVEFDLVRRLVWVMGKPS